jgi:hypothetical protein
VYIYRSSGGALNRSEAVNLKTTNNKKVINYYYIYPKESIPYSESPVQAPQELNWVSGAEAGFPKGTLVPRLRPTVQQKGMPNRGI